MVVEGNNEQTTTCFLYTRERAIMLIYSRRAAYDDDAEVVTGVFFGSQ